MAHRIFSTICILRKSLALLNSSSTRNFFRSFPKMFNSPPKILLLANSAALTTETLGPDDIKNIDLKLIEASQEGQNSVIKLMDFLKMRFIEVGQEYTESLQKQIKIVIEAGRIGAASKKWDELPQYRTHTNDMKQQYHDLVATIKTIRQSAENHAMKFISDEKHLKLIEMKCREIERDLDKFVKQIEKLEAELTAAIRDSMQ